MPSLICSSVQLAVHQVRLGQLVGALSGGLNERLAVLISRFAVLRGDRVALDYGAERVVALVVLAG